MGLHGYVENSNDGVLIVLQATDEEKELFVQALPLVAPAVATIERIDVEECPANCTYDRFEIASSRSEGDEITRVSPDIAICPECLQDRRRQPHRKDYPFINCTHCGPRFTIIQALPYDRAVTTMSDFALCDTCRSEYTDVTDRRFHAQPIACNRCGPAYTLCDSGGAREHDYRHIVSRIASVLTGGGVVALKSLGGYNLLCDADNEQAVTRLREVKGR